MAGIVYCQKQEKGNHLRKKYTEKTNGEVKKASPLAFVYATIMTGNPRPRLLHRQRIVPPLQARN